MRLQRERARQNDQNRRVNLEAAENWDGDRLDRNTSQQIIQKMLTAFPPFGCVGACDTVCKFQHCDY